MIIGLDIDDVIFDTSKVMSEILGEIKDEELISRKLDVMRGDVSIPVVAEFLKKHLVIAVKEGRAKLGAAEVIHKLHEDGNKIILITARSEENFPGMMVANEKALRDAGIEYDKVVYDSADKIDACRENGVEIFVDDSPKNCMEVRRELGIPVIGFESDITRESLHEAGIPSVNSWKELEKKLLGEINEQDKN